MISEAERQEIQERIETLSAELSHIEVASTLISMAHNLLIGGKQLQQNEWVNWSKAWASIILERIKEARAKAVDRVSSDEWSKRYHNRVESE